MKSIDIISLPPERWREAKRLRLAALRSEPAAFASSYADELAFSDEVWIARLASAFQRDGNMTYFAELNGELVGVAGANWSPREKLRHVATIYGVYVSPEQRSKGIASQLMGAVLAALSVLPQIEKVSLTVNSAGEPAIRLYERFGFQRAGRAQRELCVDGQYYDLLTMERFLTPS